MKKFLTTISLVVGFLMVSVIQCYAQKITLDYSIPFDSLVAAGSYSFVGVNAGDFPSAGSGTVEIETLSFCTSHFKSEEEILQRMDRVGYRMAKVEELLAFGAVYKTSQPGYVLMVIATRKLGSDIQTVPVAIETLDDGRTEFLITEFFPDGLCFLGVRK